MPDLQEKLLKTLEKLASSLKLNEKELNSAQDKVKQLDPDTQEKYSSVLDTIKNQLRPINVVQFNKVREVLGAQKFTGPELLSHVELCLAQSQLIEKSLAQSKELIDQAYMASTYNPGTKSKMQMNARMNLEVQEDDPDADIRRGFNPGDDPRLNKTPNFGRNLPVNMPMNNSFALLKPQMVLLAKVLRIQQEVRHQKGNILQSQADAYVDREILRVDKIADEKILKLDKDADEKILKLDKDADEKILKLDRMADQELLRLSKRSDPKILRQIEKESTGLELEVDQYMKMKIAAQSQAIKESFVDSQMLLKQELYRLSHNNKTEESMDLNTTFRPKQ